MVNTRRLRLAAAVAATLLLASACGASDEATDVASEAVDQEPSTEEASTAEEATPSETTTATETASAADGDAGGLTPVALTFVPATTGLLVNVAAVNGIFEANGLDVTLTPAANISEVIPTLGQQTDISLGTATDLIRAGDSGLDVVQISGNTIDTEDNPFVRVVVPADSDIASVTDLEGKRVGSPTLSGVIHVATLYWAQQEGVDPASIEGVQVPPPNTVDQLVSGQVDAAEALEPFATAIVGAGGSSIGDPFAAIGLPLATNFWVANGAWAEENPDVVEAFRASLEEAQQVVADDEAAVRGVLMEYMGMPEPAAMNVALPTFDLEVRTDDLGRWIEVLRSLEQFDGDVDPADLVLGG